MADRNKPVGAVKGVASGVVRLEVKSATPDLKLFQDWQAAHRATRTAKQ
jgi:hypothetical protein